MGTLTNLSLFSGVGGLDIGAKLVGGIRTVGYVEWDPYAQAVLMSRMRDGQLHDAPIWDNIKTFDARPFRGLLDIVSGGFPCQPASAAGKREGVSDDRWLFPEFARVVREARPRFVLAENVPGLLSVNDGRAFGEVLRELAGMGYDAQWHLFSAAEAGAPHLRDRVWILGERRERGSQSALSDAKLDRLRLERQRHWQQQGEPRTPEPRNDGVEESLADSDRGRLAIERHEGQSGEQCESRNEPDGRGRQEEVGDAESGRRREACGYEYPQAEGWEETGQSSPADSAAGWWSTEPDVGRVAHGVAFRVDRLRCTGNGVVPQQSVPAWGLIKKIAAQDLAVKDKNP